MRKKGVDQLLGSRTADQHLCFGYTDRLSKFQISSFYASSVTVQPGLCETLLETLKTTFPLTMEISEKGLFSTALRLFESIPILVPFWNLHDKFGPDTQC